MATTVRAYYSRRNYTRTRGGLMMMIYDKSVTRSSVVTNEIRKKHTSDVHDTSSTETPATAYRAVPPTAQQNASPSKPSSLLQRLFALLPSTPTITNRTTEPFSTGSILNLIRSDTQEVASLFQQLDRLVKVPLSILTALWLIWNLLGASCFLGLLVLAIAQLLSSLVARQQVRWRRRLQSATDARVQSTAQYLRVLRHLRWYAWQEIWLEKVMAARRAELRVRVASMCLNLTAYLITTVAGNVFPVAAFVAYAAVEGRGLSVELIFPALQLLDGLGNRMKELLDLMFTLVNVRVSLERIEEFMERGGTAETAELDVASLLELKAGPIEVKNCSFYWPGADTPALENVSLKVGGGLTLIYGQTGSGKTALLHALMGEMNKTAGHLSVVHESVGYCSQTPWLQSMSIRDNILFYSPYEKKRYSAVLNACALKPDLLTFNQGDRSQIGENGVTLSGGQRARVALARAMYSSSRILLLDDPIAALDQKTAEIVVSRCFDGHLAAGRTIVLVTHRTNLVHHLATQYVKVSEGQVSVSSMDPFSSNRSFRGGEPYVEEQASDNIALDDRKNLSLSANELIEVQRKHRPTKTKVWLTFIRAGRFQWVFLLLMMVLARSLGVAYQWFLKVWGEAYEEDRNRTYAKQKFLRFDTIQQLSSPKEHPRPWLLLLLLVTISRSFSLFMYAVSQATATVATSKYVFTRVMKALSNATFSFYDVTPTGLLMNRMTTSISLLERATNFFGSTIFASSLFLFPLLVITSVSTLFFFCATVMFGIFVWIFLVFLPTSRSLKRLEDACSSPLFSILSELLRDQGMSTIRAFRTQSPLHDRVAPIVDEYLGVRSIHESVRSWLAFRYEMLTAFSLFTLTTISLAIDLSPGMTAFVFVNADMFMHAVNTVCNHFADLRTEFVSVERLVELLDVEQEQQGTVMPPASWPCSGTSGKIEFEHVTIRYAPGLEPSLKDITLQIPGGRTTAIVGRTGSGKSTLVASLLNIVRAESGTITIDNIPLTNINVNALRRRVTFVPQDPVLFLGSIRQNLDPVDEFSDEECESVLTRVTSAISCQPWDLTTHVESGGQNLSQGQRQLIGIARAILRRSAVVILDEATASIDYATSVNLHLILREELKESTIITIAHRLEVVTDADYFVSLEDGRVLKTYEK